MTTVLDRWNNINKDLNITNEIGEKWWDVVWKMYGEPQRHYHTIHHIEELFQHFDRCQKHYSFKYPTLISLAIFFHDIVYDPKASDNEEKSAELFLEFAKECTSLTEDPIQSVKDWILLTKTHKVDKVDTEEDHHYFLDMDIAVLGRPDDRYKKYAAQIRMEYQHIPEEDYREKRAQVLKSFLNRERLFITDVFHKTYTTQAKQNLLNEIKRLGDRSIPIDNI